MESIACRSSTPPPTKRTMRFAAPALALLVAALAAACTPAPTPSWPSGTVPTATASTPTSVDVAWPAATPASGTTIATYEVSVDGRVKATTVATTRTAHLDGLKPTTSYQIGIRAKDSKGQWSKPGLTVTTTTPSYAGLASGARTVTTTFGGQTRTYYLYVPASVAANPNTPVPLVVALHGGLGSGPQLANTSQLDPEADKHGFVVAYPDGLLLPTAKGTNVRTWNAGGCCDPAMSNGVDDVGYVASVIQALEKATAIDPSHVVIGGHSNGAILTWRMACERPKVMTHAVIVEGALMVPSCTPDRGVNLTQIHGDADSFLPLAGGVGNGLSGTNFTSAAASQAMWTTAQHCASPSHSSGDHLTITTWADCAGSTTTKQVVIAGGTHAWPGADPANSADFLGAPSPYFSATQVFVDYATS